MPQRKFRIHTERIAKDTAHYTVGFALLTESGNVQDAESAGSGTLVTIGPVHGILTAAHVITNGLPSSGKIGLVLPAGDASQFAKLAIEMQHTDAVIIRAKEYGKDGPDLAFLKLDKTDVGWLEAKSSFYNLLKRREDVLALRSPSEIHMDVIVGAIHELTTDVPSETPNTRRKKFSVIFCQGNLVALKYPPGYDLLFYTPAGDPTFQLPKSFEGTSGGAIWRFYAKLRETGEEADVIDSRLVGVPFYEISEPNRQIICHGAQSIYGMLIDKVAEKYGIDLATASAEPANV